MCGSSDQAVQTFGVITTFDERASPLLHRRFGHVRQIGGHFVMQRLHAVSSLCRFSAPFRCWSNDHVAEWDYAANLCNRRPHDLSGLRLRGP